MRRIFVDHGEAYGNLGDEAMLRNALRRLAKYFGPTRFVLPRSGLRPLPALDGYDVEEVPSPYMSFVRVCEAPEHPFWVRLPVKWSGKAGLPRHILEAKLLAWSGRLAAIDPEFRAFERALKGCDAFYGVGAADFNDFNARGAAYKIWLYHLARRFTRLVVVGPQGFGPIENPELKAVMRDGLNAVDILAFRDHEFSASFMRGLGSIRGEAKIAGDEAFSLPAADTPTRDGALAAAGLAPDAPFVAVHWRATDYTQDTISFIPRLAEACDLAVERADANVLFIPMSYDVHSGNDEELGEQLRAHMRRREKLFVLPLQRDVAVIKAVIGCALFTLGLSYHVHVFGLSQGRPALILYTGEYYRYKSEGLVGFYGPPSAAIDLARATSDELATTIDGIVKSREATVSIAEANIRIHAVNDWAMTEMARRLGSFGR